MTRITGVTKHRNRHAMVETYNNITFMVKLLIAEKEFEETLGYGLKNDAESTNTNLF